MKQLTDRRVVITGAASGIGRATAIAFAAAGARVIVSDVDQDGLDGLADELGPACALQRQVDVADRAAMAAFAEAVHADGGAVDVIVNNAGRRSAGGVLEHAAGAVELSARHQPRRRGPRLPLLRAEDGRARRGGHVINIASVLGMYGAPGWRPTAPASSRCSGCRSRCAPSLRPRHRGVGDLPRHDRDPDRRARAHPRRRAHPARRSTPSAPAARPARSPPPSSTRSAAIARWCR
ncbi:MAG: SDR family NAD(P)-dependent oxidoreductase [Kofleriaceae bacterium]